MLACRERWRQSLELQPAPWRPDADRAASRASGQSKRRRGAKVRPRVFPEAADGGARRQPRPGNLALGLPDAKCRQSLTGSV